MTIEFPDEVNNVLERLAKENRSSKREVIRRALALLDYLAQQNVRGDERKLSITDQNDKILKDILF